MDFELWMLFIAILLGIYTLSKWAKRNRGKKKMENDTQGKVSLAVLCLVNY